MLVDNFNREMLVSSNAIAVKTDNNDMSKLNFCQDLEAEVLSNKFGQDLEAEVWSRSLAPSC